MKKILTVIAACVLMTACSPSVTQKHYPLPSELEGCKIFELFDGTSKMKVLYCPNKDCYSTSNSSGKTTKHQAVCQ